MDAPNSQLTTKSLILLVCGLTVISAIGLWVTPPPDQIHAFHCAQMAREAVKDNPVVYSEFSGTLTDGCRASLKRVFTQDKDAPVLNVNLAILKNNGLRLYIADNEPMERVLPSGWSLAPPLLAILLAMVWRKVIPALALAIVAAAIQVSGGNPLDAMSAAGTMLWPAVSSPFNLSIYAFTVFLIGMVGIQLRSGGLDGLIDVLSRKANTRRTAQGATAAMGLAVFFDDYANSVVVGASARPLTDRFKISREKLAYLVDCTAAPVSGIALISTWIGFEIMLFNEQREMLSALGSGGYEVFFAVLPYRFYCILSLIMVGIIAFTGRDFGPMLKAERRATTTGKLLADGATPMASEELTGLRPDADTPNHWYNGVLPILAVLVGVIGGYALAGSMLSKSSLNFFALSGWQSAFSVVGDAMDGNLGVYLLLGSAVLGSAVAALLSVTQGILTIQATANAWWRAVKAVLPTLVILALAIAIRSAVEAVHADWFLASLLGPTSLIALPVAVFLLAAATAFSTGTSWGTMGILMPVVIPLVYDQVLGHGGADTALVMALSLSAVLDGAIFGDHCSPISDTTVMSSMASACDHIDHVKTQLPYAVLVMLAAAFGGYIFVGATGVSAAVGYAISAVAIYLFVRLVGKSPA